MSTQFGVKVKGELVQVANRAYGHGLYFTNELAELLKNDRRVYVMDTGHTDKDVQTVGDVKRLSQTEYCHFK